jgi:ABC-2 type transport system permease protein
MFAILSKFLAASVLWTASYLLCLGICYAYTEYFWADDVIYNAFSAFLSLWLFGEFSITLLILGGILLKNFYGSLFTCFGANIAMSLLNIIPYVKKYNPIILTSDTLNLLNSEKSVSDFIPAMIVCTCGIVLLLVISIVTFNKKQL